MRYRDLVFLAARVSQFRHTLLECDPLKPMLCLLPSVTVAESRHVHARRELQEYLASSRHSVLCYSLHVLVIFSRLNIWKGVDMLLLGTLLRIRYVNVQGHHQKTNVKIPYLRDLQSRYASPTEKSSLERRLPCTAGGIHSSSNFRYVWRVHITCTYSVPTVVAFDIHKICSKQIHIVQKFERCLDYCLWKKKI